MELAFHYQPFVGSSISMTFSAIPQFSGLLSIFPANDFLFSGISSSAFINHLMGFPSITLLTLFYSHSG